MVSPDDDPAALAAAFGLSARGANATKPPFSYLHAFFAAMSDPFDALANPDGYVSFAVAQNVLTVDAVQTRLRDALAAKQPPSTAAYDNMRGSARLRAALASHLERVLAPRARSAASASASSSDPDPLVDPDHLCVSAGCGAVIDNLFLAIAAEGDAVLIHAPYYPAFDNDLRVRDGVVAVPVHGESAASLPTPAALDAAVDAQRRDFGRDVRAVLLTNPSNPLGIVYPARDVAAILAWGLERDVHVVVDEVYASSTFAPSRGAEGEEEEEEEEHSRFVSALELDRSSLPEALRAKARTHLHLVYGLSKDFCASGYRVGALWTRNAGVLRAMDNVAYFCCVPGPMQLAIAEMLEDASWVDAYLARNAENLREQHASLASALAAEGIAVTPARAGMFVWIDLGGSLREATWEEEWRLWTAMFERAKIVATPGRDCKSAAPGCFRLCFASVDREAMLAGVKRLGELLRAYE